MCCFANTFFEVDDTHLSLLWNVGQFYYAKRIHRTLLSLLMRPISTMLKAKCWCKNSSNMCGRAPLSSCLSNPLCRKLIEHDSLTASWIISLSKNCVGRNGWTLSDTCDKSGSPSEFTLAGFQKRVFSTNNIHFHLIEINWRYSTSLSNFYL